MSDSSFAGKRVLLGVSGSIAAYKAVDLASKLSQLGLEVDCILTQAAAAFVSPLTFQSVTGRRAYTDRDLWGAEGHVLHIGLGKEIELALLAPATANTMAKLANGDADNLLTLTLLASEAPILIAPAMDGGMYSHPATQENIGLLKQRGAEIVGPQSGHLASGLTGVGRMVEPQEMVGHVRIALGRKGKLAGRKIVVSAGGTQEAIDPVRVIANRSSGKQGYALAQAALDMGAQVTLVSGPSALKAPVGVELVQVESAIEMEQAVLESTAKVDALVMAAAVADFRVKKPAASKIKRAKGTPTIELEANPDILKAVTERRQGKKEGSPKVRVGFAAESDDLLKHAKVKLKEKGLDLLVANDISAVDAGFNVDTNRVLLLDNKGGEEQLELMSKLDVAREIMLRIAVLLDK
jgi:phosphopantothenoylcysteine decarboxylase/phosphopantothenate--cysteine ligase